MNITLIHIYNNLLLPPQWFSPLVVAISDYYTPQQILHDDVMLWIDKALEVWKNIASVYQRFVRQAIMATASSTISAHVQRIYHIYRQLR